MNIDLLFTRTGQAGLITSENLAQKALGILFDAQAGLMTLEYADMDHMEMNIPVDSHFNGALDHVEQLFIGAVKNGHIGQAYQIPLMFSDNPYRMEALSNVRQHRYPLQAFQQFISGCAFGQPVHREDLGNEEAMGCILGEAGPAQLQFAPHLARQHAQEIRPEAAPNVPGFSVPGLGGSTTQSGGSGRRAAPPPEDDE